MSTNDSPASGALSDVMTPKQLARALGVSEAHLSRLRTNGSGPPYRKLGKSRRYVYLGELVRRWLGDDDLPPTGGASGVCRARCSDIPTAIAA